MRRFLVFRLYGTMAAWGDIAVGEQRPSTPHPSKSAILGLLAAALGIRRHEDDKHQSLADGYGYAVRVDAAGVLLRDYHTTQVPESTSRLRHLRTRRDETRDRSNLYTVLSTRDYRGDTLYTVCLAENPGSRYSLETLAEHLNRPRLPLYLGRKSCPLAFPLSPRCISAQTFEEALTRYDAEQTEAQRKYLETLRHALGAGNSECDFYWETGMTDSKPLHTVPRQDLPLSRRRWQFGKRNEHYRRGGA
ncbi:type I-E CRISPR-associated protein Cas5/CasD [Methylocaldum szegediense]|uniref:type I-E CRISPR-associated protein Cas5/CasD n=1 Tax=Methylocaldum szegediense TaxID=73780 RepID=UPI000426EC21|nr:type I-E CRISPR-associated protein Cas5/CasD [Methylocaldum szegediense]